MWVKEGLQKMTALFEYHYDHHYSKHFTEVESHFIRSVGAFNLKIRCLGVLLTVLFLFAESRFVH